MTSAGRCGVPGTEEVSSLRGKFVVGGERLPPSRGGPFIGAVVFGGTCCCCVGDKLVDLLTILALLLFVVAVVAGVVSITSLEFGLVSIASELMLAVRVFCCTRMELRGDEIAVEVAVGDAADLFSMLFVLLLLLISPLVVPIRFSVEWRRFPGTGSMLFKLPLEGLCSMLFIVDDRDGPGGVCVFVSVPF